MGFRGVKPSMKRRQIGDHLRYAITYGSPALTVFHCAINYFSAVNTFPSLAVFEAWIRVINDKQLVVVHSRRVLKNMTIHTYLCIKIFSPLSGRIYLSDQVKP